MAITYWESEADPTASEKLGDEGRERAAQTAEAAGAPIVERYEVVPSS
jgi:hypothetical protein